MNKYRVKITPAGSKIWTVNGIYHRDGGPAVEYTNDSKHWYYRGYYTTEERYNWLVSQEAAKK